jgi:hypothetical protein
MVYPKGANLSAWRLSMWVPPNGIAADPVPSDLGVRAARWPADVRASTSAASAAPGRENRAATRSGNPSSCRDKRTTLGYSAGGLLPFTCGLPAWQR